MIAVGPHASGLDRAAHAVGHIAVAAPHACAQSVQRVIGDRQRFGLVLERGHRQHRAKDFLLENAHLVVALEQRRLHVVTTFQIATQVGLCAAGQHFCALLLAQIQIRQNLGELLLARLRAHHAVGVQRVGVLDRGDALERALHELVIDAFLNQRAARAGADFALIEGEQHQSFDRLVEERVVLVHHVGKEDVGRLAAQLERGRDQIVGCRLGDDATGAGRARERDFGDALAGGQRHAGFAAITVDDVQHTGRQQVVDQLGQQQDADGRAFGGLEHHRVACGQCRRELPCGHQDRKIPRNDLTDHTERLMQVIRHGVLVDLADAAFLRTQGTREIAKVIGGERDVGIQRFANRLAVVHGFGIGQQLQIGLDAIRDFQQHIGAGRGIGLAPFFGGGVGGVQCQLHVFRGRARGLRVDLAGDGRDHIEILALHRRHKLATDKVVVA